MWPPSARACRLTAPTAPNPARIVDKMLRNAWNVGHIAIALPRAQLVRMLLVAQDTFPTQKGAYPCSAVNLIGVGV